MPDHAGFAAAITVRERVLSDALLFAYSRESFSRVRTIPFLGDGPSVAITAFLSPPTVTCDGTRNALVVGVDLTGALVFTGPHGTEAEPVVAHAEVAVPPAFELMAGQLSLTPRHTDVKVIAWTYTVVGGSGFEPDTDAYLRSPLMLDRLSETVDVSSLGAIVDAAAPPPNTLALVPARVVDGALVAGLNVDGFMPPWQPPGHTGGIWLSGDTQALHDFAGDYDVAVATNPDALPILLATVEDQIVSAVGTGATINALDLTAGDGVFGVAGAASNSEGHATFSFSIVPHLDAVRPGGAINYIEKPFAIPPRPYAGLWFSTSDPNVDVSVDLPWWKTALAGVFSVLSAGVYLVSIIETIQAAEYSYGMAIAGGSSGTPTGRVHRVTSPSLADVTLRIAVETYSITPDGPFLGITIRPEPKPAALIGPRSLPANLLAEKLKYSMRLPLGVVADDLSLHIQWTVIDPSTGTVQKNDDGPANGRTTFTITPKQFGADQGKCVVGCRVYRTTGAQTTEIFNDLVHLAVTPAVAGPAYVMWAYDVQRPSVGLDATTNTWKYEGEWLAHRRSKIHRVQGGCANSAKRSRYIYSVTEMDFLPFPLTDIDLHRTNLCEYCFWGGPAGLRATL